jgi:hypothetical protein
VDASAAEFMNGRYELSYVTSELGMCAGYLVRAVQVLGSA